MSIEQLAKQVRATERLERVLMDALHALGPYGAYELLGAFDGCFAPDMAARQIVARVPPWYADDEFEARIATEVAQGGYDEARRYALGWLWCSEEFDGNVIEEEIPKPVREVPLQAASPSPVFDRFDPTPWDLERAEAFVRSLELAFVVSGTRFSPQAQFFVGYARYMLGIPVRGSYLSDEVGHPVMPNLRSRWAGWHAANGGVNWSDELPHWFPYGAPSREIDWRSGSG